MAIYPPQPALSRLDKELLELLSRLLLEECLPELVSNLPSDAVALSDEDATHLCNLLTELSRSKDFVRGAAFVELVSDGKLEDSRRARELYLEGRRSRGRLRVMASRQWAEFRARLGLSRDGWASGASAMEFDQFLEMERRLLRSLNLHPAVARLVEQLVIERSDVLDKIDKQETILRPGQIGRELRGIVNKLARPLGDRVISRQQCVGLVTVISDMSVLFTTRDWGVAGTVSTIAGGISLSLPETRQ